MRRRRKTTQTIIVGYYKSEKENFVCLALSPLQSDGSGALESWSLKLFRLERYAIQLQTSGHKITNLCKSVQLFPCRIVNPARAGAGISG